MIYLLIGNIKQIKTEIFKRLYILYTKFTVSVAISDSHVIRITPSDF